MSGDEKVEFRRASDKLAVRSDEPVDVAARRVRSWLTTPGKLMSVEPAEMRAVLRSLVDGVDELLATSARVEAIEQCQEPRPPAVQASVCGLCRWYREGVCNVDPPVIWRGQNGYRFVRPEVTLEMAACCRWAPRERGR